MALEGGAGVMPSFQARDCNAQKTNKCRFLNSPIYQVLIFYLFSSEFFASDSFARSGGAKGNMSITTL